MNKMIYCSLLLLCSWSQAQKKLLPLSVFEKGLLAISMLTDGDTVVVSHSFDASIIGKTCTLTADLYFKKSIDSATVALIATELLRAIRDFAVADSIKVYNSAEIYGFYEGESAHRWVYRQEFPRKPKFNKGKEWFTVEEKLLNYRDISGMNIRQSTFNDTMRLQFRITKRMETKFRELVAYLDKVSQYMVMYVLRNREKDVKVLFIDTISETGQPLLPLVYHVEMTKQAVLTRSSNKFYLP